MKINEYQELARRTQIPYNSNMDKLRHAVFGLTSEAGDSLDIKMSDVAEANISKLKARYPEGFDAEHSLHRKEGDI